MYCRKASTMCAITVSGIPAKKIGKPKPACCLNWLLLLSRTRMWPLWVILPPRCSHKAAWNPTITGWNVPSAAARTSFCSRRSAAERLTWLHGQWAGSEDSPLRSPLNPSQTQDGVIDIGYSRCQAIAFSAIAVSPRWRYGLLGCNLSFPTPSRPKNDLITPGSPSEALSRCLHLAWRSVQYGFTHRLRDGKNHIYFGSFSMLYPRETLSWWELKLILMNFLIFWPCQWHRMKFLDRSRWIWSDYWYRTEKMIVVKCLNGKYQFNEFDMVNVGTY